MAGEPNNTPPADEAQVEAKFKKWIGDVLDERETKAAEAKAEAEKKAAEEAEKSRTRGPAGFLESLLGKL